jgi:hypothetical protein
MKPAIIAIAIEMRSVMFALAVLALVLPAPVVFASTATVRLITPPALGSAPSAVQPAISA